MFSIDQKYEKELFDFVMDYVVTNSGKRANSEDLNGYCRFELAKIFLNGCSQPKIEDMREYVEVEHEIAIEIDMLIPMAYIGFDQNRLLVVDDIADTELFYHFYENRADHLRDEMELEDVEIPSYIKKYKILQRA